MKTSFVYNINTTRVMRKALRVTTPKAVCNTAQGIDHLMRTEYRTDDYHNQNLEFLARDYGYDEFKDLEDEFEGLTIFEPENEVELYEFCTGYNEL